MDDQNNQEDLDNLEMLNDFEEKLEQKKEEKKRLDWEKEELNKNLKELGFDTEAAAKKEQKILVKKRDSLTEKIEEKVKVFKEKYEDLLE